MNEREPNGRTDLSTADIAGTSERVSSPDTMESTDNNVTRFDRATDAEMSRDSTVDSASEMPLLPDGESYRTRWQEIQGTFVDDPRDSVSKADGLVAEAIQTLAKRFAEEREHLEHEWSGGGEPSTEDLRQALQHYRSFFQRLLAA